MRFMDISAADETLVAQLVERIQRKILTGEYRPGQRLKQVALAEEFQVSRTPIRHALSLLEARGLLDGAQGNSPVVRGLTAKDARDMYRVRAEVEGLAAELAAEWITDAELVELRRLHERFVQAVSSLQGLRGEMAHDISAQDQEAIQQEWVASNGAFHAVIYRASGNEHLQRVIADLRLGASGGLMAMSAFGMYRHRMEKNILHHEAILRAFEARDPARAREAMATHVLESGEFVAAWIEKQAARSA
ncbi:MAG: GntR family transcriptional regulator [Reyranella sp.]|jgi:DNA-binding GntR family transcriptional regulator|uniref:GntR family transcriptional regulator n=1 Tax=Reyranella sp. TaxID=1929291 RepID=UPI0025EA0404|nr:GntR family transcriptional regulator [Reyranella sp.]MBR2818173.1 GntR family transcriptional regulator [Reyranella sp.]